MLISLSTLHDMFIPWLHQAKHSDSVGFQQLELIKLLLYQ